MRIDLLNDIPAQPAAARPVLALLVHATLFSSHADPLSYAEIRDRLGLPAHSNWSLFFLRIRVALELRLPPGVLVAERRGQQTTLRLKLPSSLEFTVASAPANPALLLRICGMQQMSGTRSRHGPDETTTLQVIHEIARSDIGFRAGNFALSAEAQRDFSKLLGAGASARQSTLMYLHRLRVLRRAELWKELRVVLDYARKAAGSRGWTQYESAVLSGIVTLYEAWNSYDQASAARRDDYTDVLHRVSTTAVHQAATVNNWVLGEQHSLLALVKRRMAQSKVLTLARPERERLWQEALGHSLEAIEVACLSSDLAALANYTSNRGLILAVQLRQRSLSELPVAPEAWRQAAGWMALGEQLSYETRSGADNLWSATYFLILARYTASALQWRELMEGMVEQMARFRPYRNKTVVDLAMALAKQPLRGVLQRATAGTRRGAPERQLLNFVDELAQAGIDGGIGAPTANRDFAQLVTTLRGIRQHWRATRAMPYEETLGRFERWTTLRLVTK